MSIFLYGIEMIKWFFKFFLTFIGLHKHFLLGEGLLFFCFS